MTMDLDRSSIRKQILNWLCVFAFVVVGVWLLKLSLGQASAANASTPELRQGHLVSAGRFFWSSWGSFMLAVVVSRLLRNPRPIG
jgi:hypothetical protein